VTLTLTSPLFATRRHGAPFGAPSRVTQRVAPITARQDPHEDQQDTTHRPHIVDNGHVDITV